MSGSPDGPMKLSVIVPVRDEADSIGALLEFCAAHGDPAMEVLVIDGRSQDGTREVVSAWTQRDCRVRLIDNPDLVVTTALNLGLAAATGDVLMRLDAHAQYAPDYIEQCLQVLEETGAGNVGGAARPLSDGSYRGDLIRALHLSPFGIGAARFRREGAEGPVDTVWPGCWRRAALEAAGMHVREDLPRSEDLELNARVRGAGWEIYLSPQIKAYYQPRKSLGALLRQNFANGVGVLHTLKAGRGGVSPRHLAPLAMVLGVLGLGAVGFAWRPAWLLLAGFVALHLTLGLVFAAKAVWPRPARLWPALPGAFFLLHLSYGLGSLWGGLSRPRPARGSAP
ncbi:MAG TPA: glycosyltransferase family 2 protein [Armatimonadota bacterium]|jgi:GT2 family glycosyltransferase